MWLGFLTFFSYAQAANARAAELTYTWGDYFVMLAPWFLNFTWVTPIVFFIVHNLLTLPLKESSKRRLASYVLASFGVLFVYWTASLAMQVIIRGESFNGFQARLYDVILSTGIIDIVIYAGILMGAIGVHFYHEAMRQRFSLNQVKQELIVEQLKVLRSQLNPHFLFNTLNTVTSLVRLKKLDDATLALSELSNMLRISLANKQSQTVSVREEMQFVHSYLLIQKMRFADKLEITTDIDNSCMNVHIPNMLLHPLVENAVQHGSQSNGKNNAVSLSIHLRHNMLEIDLVNNVGAHNSHEGFGIGVHNTRERLKKLYSDFQLELMPLENGLFRTLMRLPQQTD